MRTRQATVRQNALSHHISRVSSLQNSNSFSSIPLNLSPRPKSGGRSRSASGPASARIGIAYLGLIHENFCALAVIGCWCCPFKFRRILISPLMYPSSGIITGKAALLVRGCRNTFCSRNGLGISGAHVRAGRRAAFGFNSGKSVLSHVEDSLAVQKSSKSSNGLSRPDERR